MAAGAPPNAGPSMNYHLLASLISVQSDFAIFKRFLDLNARDLLRLQGEILHLASELESVIADDRDSGDLEKTEFEFCIGSLRGAPHPSREKGLQWEKQVELGHKLSDYRTALLQYKQLYELSPVNKSDLTNLRDVLDSNRGDRPFPRDIENTIWAEGNEEDLTSLTGRYQNLDPFSKWVDSQLLRWYHNKIGYRLRDPISLAESVTIPIAHYGDSKQTATVNAISIILSSLLPVIAIFALYFIQRPLARMGAIVAFTLLFSIGLTVITNARRVDCFAATAAFVAVQVVFVGNTLGNWQVC